MKPTQQPNTNLLDNLMNPTSVAKASTQATISPTNIPSNSPQVSQTPSQTPSQPQMSLQQFGASVKVKYPQYSSMPDEEVAQKVLDKYPVYNAQIKPESGGFLKTATNIGGSIIKGAVLDPFKALILRPATYTGQAIGAEAIRAANALSGGELDKFTQEHFGQTLDERLGSVLSQDTKTPTGANIEGIKTDPMAATKQIAGQALESGTDIASLALTPGTAQGATGANTFIKGAIQGAKAGAIQGGLYGAGQGAAKSLQNNDALSTVASNAITQGVVGAGTGGLIGGVVGGVTGGIRGIIERHKAIEEGLNATRQPTDVIQYSKDPSGNIKIDKTAKEALNQGIDPRDVQFIKNASEADKQAFKDMYQTATDASIDKTVTKSPFETVGKTVVDQAKYLDKTRQQIGKQLGQTAKAMAQVPIDTSGTLSKFTENLDNAGITIGDKGELVFDGSRYADQTAVQKTLQNVYDAISANDGKLTPAQIIATRQRIFTNNNYAKAANEIVPGDFADNIIGQVYDTLDDPLKAANKTYGDLAQKYAQSSSVIRDFGTLIGKNFDLGDKFTNLRAGEVANRTLSNASAQSMSVVNNLEDTARSLGYSGEGNVRNQVLFANMLQDPKYNLFQPTQVTSLRGRVAQGALDAAKSFKGGFFPGVANLAEKGIKDIQGISPEGQRSAIESLIGLSKETPILSTVTSQAENVNTQLDKTLSEQNVAFLNQEDNSKLLDYFKGSADKIRSAEELDTLHNSLNNTRKYLEDSGFSSLIPNWRKMVSDAKNITTDKITKFAQTLIDKAKK